MMGELAEYGNLLQKKTRHLVLCLIFSLTASSLIGLMACSKESSVDKDTLVIGLESSPTNLDPRYATDANSCRLTQVLFNSLFTLDSHYRPQPDIVETWESTNDTTYIFYLKKGIAFHDGSELTSADIKYTFDTILNPASKSPHLGSFEKIKSIEPLGKYKIQFTMKEPFAPLFINLAAMGIVPKEVSQEPLFDSGKIPVGTGPFKMKEFLPDERVVLEANTSYFKGKPRLNRVIFKIIPDSTVRLLELQQGSIHFLQNDIPPDLFPFLQKQNHLKIIKKEGTTYSYVGFNLRDSVLKNTLVRQAIAHAIDREAIINYILKGLATPATGIFSPHNWVYERETRVFEHNKARALELLDEAGWPDPDGNGPEMRFELTFKTSTDQLRRRIAEVIQQELREVGIGLHIKSYEWGTFYSDIKSGNFQLFTLSWVGITDPDVVYYIFHSSSIPPNGANRGRYVNQQVDTLIEKGRLTLAASHRKKVYSSLQKILADELPYISLWHTTNVAVMNKRVHGFVVSPSGDFSSLKDVWLKD